MIFKKKKTLLNGTACYQFDPKMGFWGIPNLKINLEYGDVIHDADGNKMDLEIFNMDNCFRIKEIIQEELLPVHQEFIENKESIKPLWIYGIRSYKRGAVLEPHTDTLGTHHISSIIIVDKQVDRDWPLDIQDHQGRWHKIYAEPGDMILYESATCKHGRLEPFEGEYFRNFYLHYTLSDYKFKP
jgi:hypothetical protein